MAKYLDATGLGTLWSTAKSTFSAKSHYHNIIHERKDARSDSPTPSEAASVSGRGFYMDFVSAGGSPAQTFSAGFFINPWNSSGSDWSGGGIHELRFNQNGKIYHRLGDGNGWKDWNTIAFMSNLTWSNISGKPSTFTPSSHNHDGTYLKLSGGDLTGPITLVANGNNIASFQSAASIGIVSLKGNGTYGTRLDINNKDNTETVVRADYDGNVTAKKFIKSGGTSSQFLKADGSVDSNSYWHAGNDGTGSGLDADTLDGYHIDNNIQYAYFYSSPASNDTNEDWYLLLQTQGYITEDCVIHVDASGNNRFSHLIIHCLCRTSAYWGWQTRFNECAAIGICKQTTVGEDIYLEIPKNITTIRSIKSTHPLTITKGNYSDKSYLEIYEGFFCNDIRGSINYATSAGSVAWGNISGKPDSYTPATHNHDGTYLKLAGGTLTGKLTLQGSQYTDDFTTGALNLSNSNIQGVNAIYFADASESAQEGINFYRGTTSVDTVYAKSGVLYFTPNRTLGSAGTDYTVLHSNNYTSYTVKKDGTGASGTWGISISGNAATATSATSTSRLSSITLPNGADMNNYTTTGVYGTTGTSDCASFVNGPSGRTNGEMRLEVIGCNNSDSYLFQKYWARSGQNWQLYIRSKCGSGSTNWTDWKRVAMASEIPSTLSNSEIDAIII